MDIKLLHKEGHSIKEIVRQTGHSRNTVRQIIRAKEPRVNAHLELTPKRFERVDDRHITVEDLLALQE